MGYWFYRLKEVVDSPYAFNNVDNIEQDVFIADSRDDAKRFLKERFPNLPLRKPKDASVGARYLYLIESNEYWYNKLYGEVHVKCCWCASTVTVIGEKNILRSHLGEYCSEECKNASVQVEQQKWINKDDHVCIREQKGVLMGYVYKITNKHTMMCYVGQTINAPLFRWWEHLKRDRKFEQSDLSDLVFEVLEVVHYDTQVDTMYRDAKDKLNKREAHYIRLFDAVEEGYNEVQPKEIEPSLITSS